MAATADTGKYIYIYIYLLNDSNELAGQGWTLRHSLGLSILKRWGERGWGGARIFVEIQRSLTMVFRLCLCQNKHPSCLEGSGGCFYAWLENTAKPWMHSPIPPTPHSTLLWTEAWLNRKTERRWGMWGPTVQNTSPHLAHMKVW